MQVSQRSPCKNSDFLNIISSEPASSHSDSTQMSPSNHLQSKLGHSPLRTSKQIKREAFIKEGLAKLEERKQRLEREKQEAVVTSLSQTLARDMVENGKKLNPYEAMLHARRISKHFDANELLKHSESMLKTPVSSKP